MVLVIGLGNPGKNYEKTRHNVGFRLIDALVRQRGASDVSKQSFKGELYKDAQNLFLKPTTFMNLSGESALPVLTFYKPTRIMTIHDDLDLPFGAIRLKRGGGHGGHNGLKSLDKHIGTNYYRLRIGIGKPQEEMVVADYVLARFSQNEEYELDSKLLPHALLAINEFISMEDDKAWDRLVSRYTLSPKKAVKDSRNVCILTQEQESTRSTNVQNDTYLPKKSKDCAQDKNQVTPHCENGESKCR